MPIPPIHPRVVAQRLPMCPLRTHDWVLGNCPVGRLAIGIATDVSAPDARLGTRKLPGGPACHRNSYRYLPLTLAWNGRPFVLDESIFILPAPMKFKQMRYGW